MSLQLYIQRLTHGCHLMIRLWMLCLVCKSLNERHSTSKDRGNVDLCTCNLGIWQMDVPTCRKTWRVAANDQPLPAAITREACMTCSTIAHTAYSRETVGRLSRTDGLEPIWLRATEKNGRVKHAPLPKNFHNSKLITITRTVT